MKIITRQEAKEQGLIKFYTGKPCKHGHLSERYTKKGNCCECNRLAVKAWKQENKEYINEYKRQYYSDNQETYAEYNRTYHKKTDYYLQRYHNDLEFKLKHICRCMVGRVLRLTKQSHMTSLGYTAQEFKSHIESLFTEGMTWDNYGDWQIDHIKPLSVSISEGITDLKELNALSNLQPLWALDNINKGAKYERPNQNQ